MHPSFASKRRHRTYTNRLLTIRSQPGDVADWLVFSHPCKTDCHRLTHPWPLSISCYLFSSHHLFLSSPKPKSTCAIRPSRASSMVPSATFLFVIGSSIICEATRCDSDSNHSCCDPVPHCNELSDSVTSYKVRFSASSFELVKDCLKHLLFGCLVNCSAVTNHMTSIWVP